MTQANTEQKLPDEQRLIVKCIFKGMTISEIAQKMCCSDSTVSYQINLLYAKYKAKNRSEFMLSVFSGIIDDYKKLLSQKIEENLVFQKESDEIKNILYFIAQNRDNPIALDYWIQETKKYL